MVILEAKKLIVNSFKKSYLLINLLLCILSIMIFYNQNYFTELYFKNIIFSDGIGYLQLIRDVLIYNTKSIFDIKAAWLLLIIYFLPVFVFGTLGAILLNSYLLYKSFQLNVNKEFNFIYILLFIPFFLISSLLPNKEILTLFFSILYIKFIYDRNFFIALIIGLIVFLIRDGQGILLILTSVILFLKIPIRFGLLLLLIVSICIDYFLKDIASYTQFFALQRVLWIIESLNVTYFPYLIRVFGNLMNLGSRVPIFDFDFIYVTGWTLYLSGIGILMAFLSSFYALFIKFKVNDYFNNFLSGFYIFSILLFSISPLIQPRYLIPIALIYLINNTRFKKNIYFLFFIAFTLLFTLKLVYIIGDFQLPQIDGFNTHYNDIFYGGFFLND